MFKFYELISKISLFRRKTHNRGLNLASTIPEENIDFIRSVVNYNYYKESKSFLFLISKKFKE